MSQIIATVSIAIPYSTLHSPSGIVFRCPEGCSGQGQCRSCSWLTQRTATFTGKELAIETAEELIKSASLRYDIVSWSTLSHNQVEVGWMLRSSHHSGEPLKTKLCEQNGISTCGIEFCSDDLPPSSCVSPNVMNVLFHVIAICTRRVTRLIHKGRLICKGFYLRSRGNSTFVLILQENPSLIKLLQYGMCILTSCMPFFFLRLIVLCRKMARSTVLSRK